MKVDQPAVKFQSDAVRDLRRVQILLPRAKVFRRGVQDCTLSKEEFYRKCPSLLVYIGSLALLPFQIRVQFNSSI